MCVSKCFILYHPQFNFYPPVIKNTVFSTQSNKFYYETNKCKYSLQVTHNASPVTPLTIGGTVLNESDDLVILGVTFDSKLTFEKHLRLVSRAASQILGILRKSWRVFHDRLLLERCFRSFVLPVLEYCSAVWCSAADTHLKLLDRAVMVHGF